MVASSLDGTVRILISSDAGLEAKLKTVDQLSKTVTISRNVIANSISVPFDAFSIDLNCDAIVSNTFTISWEDARMLFKYANSVSLSMKKKISYRITITKGKTGKGFFSETHCCVVLFSSDHYTWSKNAEC